jgi:putative endonuclease
MYFVYTLFSKKDHKLYVGYTNNLKRRIKEHQSGKVEATIHRLPIVLIYYESYLRWSDAHRREKYLKGGNGRAQLKIQLQDIFKSLGYKHQK